MQNILSSLILKDYRPYDPQQLLMFRKSASAKNRTKHRTVTDTKESEQGEQLGVGENIETAEFNYSKVGSEDLGQVITEIQTKIEGIFLEQIKHQKAKEQNKKMQQNDDGSEQAVKEEQQSIIQPISEELSKPILSEILSKPSQIQASSQKNELSIQIIGDEVSLQISSDGMVTPISDNGLKEESVQAISEQASVRRQESRGQYSIIKRYKDKLGTNAKNRKAFKLQQFKRKLNYTMYNQITGRI